MYDSIIVGARVAGSATALQLARKGHRVLLVDRAAFPSDTMSTHFIKTPAIRRFSEWGVLDEIIASGSPATRDFHVDFGPVTLNAIPAGSDGIDTSYSPRRTVLDKILVDAAVAAGAELRENFTVDELTFDGEKVAGIRGRTRDGRALQEQASVVVGADGMHSFVARSVQAPAYNEKGVLTCAYYGYFELGMGDDFHEWVRPQRTCLTFPTNDGLNIVYATVPAAEFQEFRTDVEGNFLKVVATSTPNAYAEHGVKEGSSAPATCRTSSASRSVRVGHWWGMRGTIATR
jgi:2-polyprenyl-6-methoxyphenol hydroxylase-like FAD-dependent oxidoreductase